MNKQDKIKKVMREFKNGKLKTPNGEVVTDKKQALAIAMSESEDYAEKADLIEDISIGSLSDAEDVIKGIGSEELFEKAVYADTAENRKLGRVGQEYHRGRKKKNMDDGNEGGSGKKSAGKGSSKSDVNFSKFDAFDRATIKNAMAASKKDGKIRYVSIDSDNYIGISDHSNTHGDKILYIINSDGTINYFNKTAKEVIGNGTDEPTPEINARKKTPKKFHPIPALSFPKKLRQERKESQKHYKIKSNTEVKKAIDDEMGISDAYHELFGEDLEKAHQDGDIHPKHPDWVWVSSASGGKGDWRKVGGRIHKKHQENNGKQGNEQPQTKTIADHVSETKTETLKKVVSSNAPTQLKQAAQKELKKREDSRKKSIKGKKKQSSTTQNVHIQKLIDFYKISSSRYTDTSKMSIVITPKGNWNLRYDGKDVSTISGYIMDRKTLENAGIKFEDSKKRPVGAGTNGPTPKTKADKKVK